MDFWNVKQSDIEGVSKMLGQIQERVPTTKRIKTYIIICQETHFFRFITPTFARPQSFRFFLYMGTLKTFKCIQHEFKMKTLHQGICDAC